MMHLWLLFGLAVFAQDLQVVEVKSGKNECKNFRSSEVRTHEAMIRCLDMVKLNNARRNSTLDTLRSVISFYVFDDLTRNPNNAYPTPANQRWDLSPVDLDGELQALYTKKFDSERKFHQEVAQVLRKPLDGHLTYTPSCFSSIKFFLPLALQPAYDNGMSVTTIPGTMFGGKLIEYTQNQLGIDLSKYFGARVVAIDGKDPIKALSEMAKAQIGVAKDPSTRLNMMFLSPVVVGGSPNVVWGGFAAPPNTPTNPWVELTFQDKTTIRLPYLTTHKLGFSNAKDFFTSRCLESSYISAQSEPEDELNINLDSLFQTSLLNTNEGSASDLLGFLPPYSGVRQVTSNSWITTFLLADNKTGVVTYPSNKANTVPELNEFLKTFHSGLQELKEMGADQLIVDVSHNTGGPICASLMLIDYFAGSDAPIYTTNMRANQLASSLALKAANSEPGYRVWGPSSWMVDQKSTYSSMTWMVPPSSVTRDSQYFSSPIIDRCPASPIKSSPLSPLQDGPREQRALPVLLLHACRRTHPSWRESPQHRWPGRHTSQPPQHAGWPAVHLREALQGHTAFQPRESPQSPQRPLASKCSPRLHAKRNVCPKALATHHPSRH
ncbi:hypothetical protein DSO57_1036122 [Entomophthora muscae]|uniref:Uncharacterized protein n=1 Tax=Entomophthora muscae TaxID=34485 RepID=A0ACC2S1J5_9FUNG|nr:hypothetical protein DSO57_1036122 [Entomophthora muscae]